MLVLDEADEMLNKGFKEQIYDVYRYLPPATQVIKDVHYIHNVSFQENLTNICDSWKMTFITSSSFLQASNNKPHKCNEVY